MRALRIDCCGFQSGVSDWGGSWGGVGIAGLGLGLGLGWRMGRTMMVVFQWAVLVWS